MRVDAVSKVAELELAEKEKMKAKVEKILKHNISVFINRYSESIIFQICRKFDTFLITNYFFFH